MSNSNLVTVLGFLRQIAESTKPGDGYVDRLQCAVLAKKCMQALSPQNETPKTTTTIQNSPEAFINGRGDSLVYDIYADGACKGNPGPSSWGAAAFLNDKVVAERCDYLGVCTNQVAELHAAINGLMMLAPGSCCNLYSDSQYVIQGLTTWRKGWENRGMKTATGTPLANLDLWVKLYALNDERNVRPTWVRGHNGNPGNELADSLANKAIESSKK